MSFHLRTLLLTETTWDDLKGPAEAELRSLPSIAVAFNAVCGEASLTTFNTFCFFCELSHEVSCADQLVAFSQ